MIGEEKEFHFNNLFFNLQCQSFLKKTFVALYLMRYDKNIVLTITDEVVIAEHYNLNIVVEKRKLFSRQKNLKIDAA